MKQIGIVCKQEGSAHYSYACPKKITRMEDISRESESTCRRCLKESTELKEFSSRERDVNNERLLHPSDR